MKRQMGKQMNEYMDRWIESEWVGGWWLDAKWLVVGGNADVVGRMQALEPPKTRFESSCVSPWMDGWMSREGSILLDSVFLSHTAPGGKLQGARLTPHLDTALGLQYPWS